MSEANTASTGTQLLAADKDELAKLVERCTVFAKVTPQQKMAVVAALQAAGHIVGFLGDGNNDALALRKADVGVSVDSGASVSVHFKPWLRKAAQLYHIKATLEQSSAAICHLLEDYHLVDRCYNRLVLS